MKWLFITFLAVVSAAATAEIVRFVSKPIPPERPTYTLEAVLWGDGYFIYRVPGLDAEACRIEKNTLLVARLGEKTHATCRRVD
jgi:hypothetical protein